MLITLRLKIIRIYLWLAAIFLLFWSPLSHWVYPDFYHYTLNRLVMASCR